MNIKEYWTWYFAGVAVPLHGFKGKFRAEDATKVERWDRAMLLVGGAGGGAGGVPA